MLSSNGNAGVDADVQPSDAAAPSAVTPQVATLVTPSSPQAAPTAGSATRRISAVNGAPAAAAAAAQAGPPTSSTSKQPAALSSPPQNAAYWLGFGGALRKVRGAVSKKKKRFVDAEGGFDLDLSYITPRIIAMGFPSQGREGLYRNPMPEVQRFFETRHSGHYRVYNLCSERAYDPAEFGGCAARYPFDDHNPCPLHMIGAFCADVDAWLTAHPENVVAVHCKAGKGRTGLMIAAYLLHCGYKPHPEAALRAFGLARTANGKGVTIPSQMRYVHYYSQILRHGFPVAYTYRLTHLRLRTIPAMELAGGCVPSFALFNARGDKLFDFHKAVGGKLRRYKKGEPYADLDASRWNVTVAGDVKLQLYHVGAGMGVGSGTSKMCHLWVHTGYITRNYLLLGRHAVDKANKDTRGVFAPNFAIELYLHRVDEPPMQTLKVVQAMAEAEAARRARNAIAVAGGAAGGSGTGGGGASGMGAASPAGIVGLAGGGSSGGFSLGGSGGGTAGGAGAANGGRPALLAAVARRGSKLARSFAADVDGDGAVAVTSSPLMSATTSGTGPAPRSSITALLGALPSDAIGPGAAAASRLHAYNSMAHHPGGAAGHIRANMKG